MINFWTNILTLAKLIDYCIKKNNLSVFRIRIMDNCWIRSRMDTDN